MSSFQNIKYRNNLYLKRNLINNNIYFRKQKEKIIREQLRLQQRIKKLQIQKLKIELQRREQERIERERIEQERIERERLEQERLEREQINISIYYQNLFVNELNSSRIEINITRENFNNVFDNNILNNYLEYENNDDYKNETINENIFNKLKRAEYNKNFNDICPICYENFKISENIIILNCNHNFHNDCIKKWLCEFSNTCPLCKDYIN